MKENVTVKQRQLQKETIHGYYSGINTGITGRKVADRSRCQTDRRGKYHSFISRYRKEATGSLNDEILRNLHERLLYLRNLEDKKNRYSQASKNRKTDGRTEKSILEAQTLVVVEDLYRPYRPKRRTRATIAKEKGLEPLANLILLQMTDKSIEEEAESYVSEEKEVKM